MRFLTIVCQIRSLNYGIKMRFFIVGLLLYLFLYYYCGTDTQTKKDIE